MATLTNTKIKDTYDGLLKTTDNDVIGTTEKVITDGLGNASILSIGTQSASFSEDIEINGQSFGVGAGSISSNVAIGLDSLNSNTTGSYNVAIGNASALSNTTGARNIAIGFNLLGNTTGNDNISLGLNSLYFLTGSNNIAIGRAAGQYSTGTLNKTAGDHNIYIGDNTVSGGQDTDNEIVIGYGTTGNGSNTATYGNSSITDHYFDGNVRADFFYGDGSNLTNLPSSTIPTLQQVTTAGSTTDRTIVIERQVSPTLDFEDSSSTGNTSSYIRFKRTNSSTNYGRISYDSVGDEMVFSTQTPSNTVLTLNSSGHGEFTNNLNVGGNLAVDTNTLYVDAAGNRVGIGTSSPQSYYSGADNLVVSQSSGEGGITIATATNTTGALYFADGTSGSEQYRGGIGYNHSNDELFIVSGGSTKATIDSSGRVGIGTSSPARQLTIQNSGNAIVSIRSGNTSASFLLMGDTDSDNIGMLKYDNSDNSMQFYAGSNSSERMRIESSGNVGIGTQNPNTLMHIRGAAATLTLGDSTQSSSSVSTILFKNLDGNGANREIVKIKGLTGANGGYGNIVFETAFNNTLSERMRINASGNVSMTGSGNNPLTISSSSTGYETGYWYSDTKGIGIATGAGSGWTNLLYLDKDSNEAKFFTNGSERMRIDSSGNVGIGTQSPTVKLEVNSGTDNGVALFESTDSAAYIDIKDNTGYGRIVSGNSGDMWFSPNGTERMRIDSSGNVGIGTQNPENSMTILKNSNSSSANGGEGQLRIYNTNSGSGTTGIWLGNSSLRKAAILAEKQSTSNNHDLLFLTNGANADATERMRIDSSGNVGIGEQDPSGYWGQAANLVLTDGNSGLTIKSSTTGNGRVVFTDTKSTTAGLSDGGMIHYDHNSDSMQLHANGAERMRITSAGDVLIGTTTAITSLGNTIQVKNNSNLAYFQYSSSSGTGSIVFRNASNSTVGTIAISNTATAYNTSSDYRLKENVVEMTGALDRVDALKPSRFNFIGEDRTVDGFIAHEVAEIVPEAVTGEKDAVDEEGNPIYQGIDQSKIVPLLVGAIKELRAEIELLKSQLNA